MITREFDYTVLNQEYMGFLAYPDSKQSEKNNVTQNNQLPGVLIVPAFEGLTQLYKDMAIEYARLGYVALAVDLYGDGKVCHTLEECLAECMPHIENRQMTRDKMLGIYEIFKDLPMVDSNNIAIFGFCLGGMCALDLARAGAEIKGAVSIHGVLAAPDLSKETISAKILVLHGYQDPQVPPQQLTEFAQEMDNNNVDWQFHFFSQTKHAFTDPNAADIGAADMGREYNALSTTRSHEATKNFLAEIFAD